MPAIVECYAGASYPERPRAFQWQGKRKEVAEIERRYRVPGGLRFRVRARDGRRFFLLYHQTADAWEVLLQGRA